MAPVPASPTYSTTNPPCPPHAVLTKADLEHSQTAYADLLASAKAYRLALASLSTAASAFGSALESCARLKEARADALVGPAASSSLSNSFTAAGAHNTCTADPLLTVAGLQHLVANHQQILSETVYRAFEVPLLHELDKWRGAVDDEEERYARAAAQQGREIRRLEREGLRLHRQARRRDVARSRSHLVELTAKLDGLTALHGDHARALLRESQEASGRIVEASCSLARAEVDIFESLARKGWTGGGLENVLEKGVDLFAAEIDPVVGSSAKGGGGSDGVTAAGSGEGSKLFSILPPKSILADTSGTDTVRPGNHTRSDSLLVDADRYQSLAGAVVSSDLGRGRDRDTDSLFSELNRSRNVRPFSPQPQPLRWDPEDLIGSLQDGTGESSSGSGPPDRADNRNEECAVEEDEDAHPWRNEGLPRETPSDNEDQDRAGPQPREESWSAADVDT